MFEFIKTLFTGKAVDPNAVNSTTVRRYIKTLKRFDRAYNNDSCLVGMAGARDLYRELQLLRERANRATNTAINVAIGLPENAMVDASTDGEAAAALNY